LVSTLRKVAIAVVMAVTISMFVALPALGASNSSSTRCIDVYFLAYSQSSHSGAAIPAKICLEPYTGERVVVKGAAYGKSLLDSFIVAVHDLETYCGLNLSDYTILVDFEEHGLKISGSSGSLLFALAVLDLMNRTHLPPRGWSATGVTSIDGFIDAVGAVPYKLRAAESVGIKTAYLPLLDKPFANVSGITKVFLTEISELCRATKLQSSSTQRSLAVNTSVLSLMYRRLSVDAHRFIEKARQIVQHINNEKLKHELTKFIYNRSLYVRELLNEGHVYSAASLSFDTYIRTLFFAAQTYTPKELDMLIENASHIDHHVLKELKNMHALSLHAMTTLIVVLNRIKDSLFYISLYRNLSIVPAPRSYPPAYAALYAYARALTVETWYDLLRIANASGGPYIEGALAIKAVDRVLDIVSNTIEFSPRYAPLSLDALADTRSYLAEQLSNASREIVLSTLKQLYALNARFLDPVQRIVPYLYVLYAKDLVSLGIGSVVDKIYFYSLSSLLAAATRWALSFATHKTLTPQIPAAVPPHRFSIKPSIGVAAWLAASIVGLVCALLALRPLHIVEKSSGLRLSTP